MAETPLDFRRRFGLDRSGPAPSETRPGAPLRPWTIPNAIGYLRLAGIPVFLYLSLESGDGHDPWAAGLFWLIAAGDYLDGFVARATGQYSRMGALLDPVVDRLTILSGAAVCWHFELLPRWALAVLAAREVVTLVLAQLALRKGQALEINWFGRIAVFPIMASIFFALVVESVVWNVMLIVGVVLAVLATVVYTRTGLRRIETG
ncbi:MAG TPA: CDP-alcohol phosphatidyltransferase family protein [Solirubrobacterales bacterium]|nr:CDP-alcohol phosphatidyltransferase family protein [Solirubrobacterales bacterium]